MSRLSNPQKRRLSVRSLDCGHSQCPFFCFSPVILLSLDLAGFPNHEGAILPPLPSPVHIGLEVCIFQSVFSDSQGKVGNLRKGPCYSSSVNLRLSTTSLNLVTIITEASHGASEFRKPLEDACGLGMIVFLCRYGSRGSEGPWECSFSALDPAPFLLFIGGVCILVSVGASEPA